VKKKIPPYRASPEELALMEKVKRQLEAIKHPVPVDYPELSAMRVRILETLKAAVTRQNWGFQFRKRGRPFVFFRRWASREEIEERYPSPSLDRFEINTMSGAFAGRVARSFQQDFPKTSSLLTWLREDFKKWPWRRR